MPRQEVALATGAPGQGIDDGYGGIGHMDKAFTSFGHRHYSFAVTGEKQFARAGLGVVGTYHKAGIDNDNMPVGVLTGSLKERLLPCPFTEGIIGAAERGLHECLFVGTGVGCAIAYGVGCAGVHKTGDACAAHQLQQAGTEVPVHRQIVLVAEQRHVCHPGTIDNGIAALGGLI